MTASCGPQGAKITITEDWALTLPSRFGRTGASSGNAYGWDLHLHLHWSGGVSIEEVSYTDGMRDEGFAGESMCPKVLLQGRCGATHTVE